ncbi:MAG: bifunctional diaminohydroxyphosphoribosylaminopyrimidine deaminase/5-amino-6-(5-phosphoribosylamino)uracil reductase RibD [Betaproteobacteria bacterium]|nr:bifunctional diaminohydroxyphosphoribosylaminopyrimidine deaminase/5-amino-6-(5-phosphoribosylamino)uracil reductase RibD [Betaproteobacteria bacterium]
MATLDPIAQALQLAQSAKNLTSPNPRVGCVLISAQGQIIGQGHTQAAGGPHAEVMAIRDAAAKGHSTQGATAYVTLEPCSHLGRTGPCCDALIKAGIRRVVASLPDPNPLVAGQGFERLRDAGIDVELGPGGEASRELNIGFFSRMLRKTPWVRMKIAASLDGKTALPDGHSQWITGVEARTDGHAWRARSCAVLTGIGTVLQDQPRLDVRLVETPRQPHLVIVDSQLETPLDAPLFIANRQVWIYGAVPNSDKQTALEARGAQVRILAGPVSPGKVHPKVDLTAMMHDLAKREINELHVEAGEKLNGSLVSEGLVDEFLLYYAPKLIGQGLGMAGFGPLAQLKDAIRLEFQSIDRCGLDLRVLARVAGRDRF